MANIRTFRPSDMEDVIALADRTLGETYNRNIYTTVFQVSPEGFIVAYEGNRFIGFSLAIPEEKSLRILMLSVHERYHRKGIGKTLLSELISRFLAKGFTKLTLEVRVSNGVAIEFYRKLGFSIDGLIPNYYSTGEGAYKMTRAIG